MAKTLHVVPMLMRTFELLEVFRELPEGVSYPDLLARLPHVSKVSVYRILCSLVAAGYMYKDPRTNLYHLGAKFIELGRFTERGQDVLKRLRPYAEALVERFGETVNVARIENGELVYLAILEGHHPLRVTAMSSRRKAVYSSSVGKAILAAMPEDERDAMIAGFDFERITPHTLSSKRALRADLAETARRGYALDNEENLVGVRCVGAAVRDLDERPVAAVSITGPASRLDEAALHEMGRHMAAMLRDVYRADPPAPRPVPVGARAS